MEVELEKSVNNDRVAELNQILDADEVPFAALQRSFGHACEVGRIRRFVVQFAGFPVQIQIVGNRWAELVGRAIGHLPRPNEGQAIALHIDAWDAEEVGVLPELGLVDLDGPPTVMKSSSDGWFVGEERHHGTLWLDRRGQHVTGCIASVDALTLDARARPFHKLLSAWLFDRGVQFVHAGLVSEADSALLFVGNGGAGKSTASICCLCSGMGFLGDDFVGISRVAGGFVGHGFYASCLLGNQHIKRFPEIAPHAYPPNLADEQKHVAYLQDGFHRLLEHQKPIRAIALPRVVDAPESSFEKASKVQALKAIAPTSVMYLPRPSKEAFETLSELVASVPTYWFNSGCDINGIGGVVRSFLQNLD